jgi:hypothetical protein
MLKAPSLGETDLLVRPAYQYSLVRNTRDVAAQIEHRALSPVDASIEFVVDGRVPETLDRASDAPAELDTALSNAAGEDERVDGGAELDVVRADVVENAVGEQVKCEARARVIGDGAGCYELEVGGAGEGVPPGVPVEDLFGVRDVRALGGGVVCVVEDEGGIYGA